MCKRCTSRGRNCSSCFRLLRLQFAGPAVVVTTIVNESGQPVYRLAAPLGQSRSQGAVLLAAGTYTVSSSLLRLGQVVDVPVSYVFSGTAISDPFAFDPNNPTTNPFTCTDPGSTRRFAIRARSCRTIRSCGRPLRTRFPMGHPPLICRRKSRCCWGVGGVGSGLDRREWSAACPGRIVIDASRHPADLPRADRCARK